MSDILSESVPWLRFTNSEHEKGSGILCARCGGHQKVSWSASQISVTHALAEARKAHGSCPMKVPTVGEMPQIERMTLPEAMEEATVFWDEGIKAGMPQEVRMAIVRIGPYTVIATKRGLDDPTFAVCEVGAPPSPSPFDRVATEWEAHVPSPDSPTWSPL